MREDLIGQVEGLPSMLDFKVQAENDSMYNTPPTFAIYVAKLVFEWIKEQGGVAGIEALNRKKRPYYMIILINRISFLHRSNLLLDRSRMFLL